MDRGFFPRLLLHIRVRRTEVCICPVRLFGDSITGQSHNIYIYTFYTECYFNNLR